VFRAILWKEFREQGLIAISLVVLGSGVLAAAAMLADPPAQSVPPTDVIRYLGLGRLATLMLAVTAGMVCGGAVFAAEREAGTMVFLESLPSTRWRLWQAKVFAGAALAIVQILLLVLVAAALGFVSNLGWALAVFVYSMLAFAWGMFGSTSARTTLGSVGLAIPVAIVAGLILMIPILVFFQQPGSSLPRPLGGLIFLVGMLTVPIVVSAWQFTREDRERRVNDHTAQRRSQYGLHALQWLTVRQALGPGLVISAFALLFGLILLAPGIQPVLIWPELALLAGILAGVTAFADEQTRGVARFWGEQRLPLGRFWVTKLTLHFALCLGWLLLLATPLIVRTLLRSNTGLLYAHTSLATIFKSLLLDELGRQSWKYLLLPAVYGFVAGHLAGLLFRKLVVACGVAAIVAGVGVAVWMPSLMAGGVYHWQLWLPAVGALVVSRLLMRPWTADRLASRGPLTTLVGGSVAVLGFVGVGLSYRVLEVPDRPGSDDDISYVAGLLPFDENVGGREFRTAAERYVRLASVTSSQFDQSSSRPAPGGGRGLRVEERLGLAVTRTGWPADDSDLDAWLNALFASSGTNREDVPWHVLATTAAGHPVGIYEYPQTITVTGSSVLALENAQKLALALLGRGLQQQAQGNPKAFISAARITLTLAQTLRNGSGVDALRIGNDIERTTLTALDRWLGLPPGAAWAVQARTVLSPIPEAHPVVTLANAWIHQVVPSAELLREAIPILVANNRTEPFDPRPHYLAERFALRELLKSPDQWLPRLLTPAGGNPDTANPEVDLVNLGWAVPWERERTRRLLGLGFETGSLTHIALLRGRPGAEYLILRNRTEADLVESDRLLRGYRRAAILKLALRAFHADQGRYPDPDTETLAILIRLGYLQQLPSDPFDDRRTLGYRISAGETLLPSNQSLPMPRVFPGGPTGAVSVRRGQPILWSVGNDQVDQGGLNTPLQPSGPGSTGDIVYLVPRGPNS
jgi:hypothetical protein